MRFPLSGRRTAGFGARHAYNGLLRRVECAAWALGLFLVLIYGGARMWADAARAQGLASFEQVRAARLGDESKVAPRHPAWSGPEAVDQSLWSTERIAAFNESLAPRGVPEAVLRIPSVRLEVPVYSGTTELNLNRGAAHIEGTAGLGPHGNIGIAAHRDGFFRKLEDVRLDAVILLDLGLRALRYRVVDIRIVVPEDVRVLAPTGTPMVTLVTCYPFYFLGAAPQRYIVRAELVASEAAVPRQRTEL